ncbi:MAG: cytochrome C oxidase subunit I [Chloroflexota bacterium]|nr:MAG: cytochrome C oxidase subunit I [Chloroflexota bacterium]
MSFHTEDRLASWHIAIAVIALAFGMTLGFFQGLEHAGMDIYPALKPFIQSYYQGLTLHGVLNVLVWTTFFICGFLIYVTTRSLRTNLVGPKIAWLTLVLMIVGLVMAAVPILTNSATVLFTFYPPMKADPFFYIGLTLVVIGTWLVTLNLTLTWRAWRARNPVEKTPLAAFMSLVTMAMWSIASVGIAIEMLVIVIPMAVGLTEFSNPVLARTLFWFTGHPIVYFWLLPAYISWYTMVPRQAGGKLFSDPMARVSFLLFLVLSTPLGLHHQVSDPGILPVFKAIHAVVTFGVFFPSLMTFFNVVASLENSGRHNGGKGLFGWIFRLPWKDPIVTGQILAMWLFVFGGIGGLINASYQLNQAVHNTAWIAGHFHLTVGSAVTLTFMAVTYWLVPNLSGRELFSIGMARWQVWIWFIGMIVFSNNLHRLGLMDVPRRTALGSAPYILPEWRIYLPWVALGGALLFISGVLYILNLAFTLWGSPRAAPIPMPMARAISGPDHAPAIVDRWRPWLAVAAVLILVAYLPVFVQILLTSASNAPGLRVW